MQILTLVYHECKDKNILIFQLISVSKSLTTIVELSGLAGLTICLKSKRNFTSLENSSLKDILCL